MIPKKKHLYIPIELKNRELDSQVILASDACKNGYRVYIGTHAAIYSLLRSKRSKGGIFLDKGTQRKQLTEWIRSKCEAIYILDQELGPSVEDTATPHEENFISNRFYPGTIEMIDGFFCVGPVIFDAASAAFGSQEIVHKSGWPRIDIQQKFADKIYADQIQELKKNHGQFLLFISDFGLLHPLDQMRDADRVETLLHAMPRENWDKTYRDFETTVRILIAWDKDPDVPKIIVRPHINEDIRIWQKSLSGLTKTFVIHKGEITPWISASSGVIHRGSTVAIQAKLMNKAVFYIKEAATAHERPRIEKFSDFVVSAVKPPLGNVQKGSQSTDIKTLFNEVIYADAGTASARMIDVLNQEETELETRISRTKVFLSYLTPRALRRLLGLTRDEFAWLIGSSSRQPQRKNIPHGIRQKDLRVGLKVDLQAEQIQTRFIGINLWELDLNE